MIIGIIIAVILIVGIIALTRCYNRLVVLKNRVKNQEAQVDVQLKRRMDLIPNLIEVTKGYAAYEQDTLQKIVELRGKVMRGTDAGEALAAEETLNQTVKQILAIGEQYPELKANQNFLQLSGELSETEDKISKARQFYNDTATKYNTEIMKFPTSIVAGVLGFRTIELPVLQADERQRIRIKGDMLHM